MSALTPAELLRLALPGAICFLLLILCALPMALLDLPLTPHVVWLMTLCIAGSYPAAWPVTLAFLLGLLSDFLYATPLGAQALLTLGLTLVMHAQQRRLQHQLFHLRWLEVAVALFVLHLLLWVMLGLVGSRPPLIGSLLAALVSALWFPAFYLACRGLITLLPSRN